MEALSQWNGIVKQHADLARDRRSLETIAWGVINKGEHSRQMAIRLNSLIGAAMTRDAKAIPLILDALRDSNSMLRAISVSLAAEYGDLPLQEEISRLLKEETVWYVRLELIKAIGRLRMVEMKEHLLQVISNQKTLAEEKSAAIVALVTMYDQVGDGELDNLIKSPRAGLRQMAPEVMVHLEMADRTDLLIPLLTDHHPQVRIGALNALALLKAKSISGTFLPSHQTVQNLMRDHVPEVAITANWLGFIHSDRAAAKRLEKYVLGEDLRIARLAAGAIAISGKVGAPLAKKLIKKSVDPYIRATLSLNLVGQRTAIQTACNALAEPLAKTEGLMWDSSLNPLFRFLSPSRVTQTSQIPNYPQVVDQLTRLELLQILCVLKYPKAEDSVKEFLKNSTWGAVGMAASTLLREGDDEALALVKGLLKDPEDKIRIQAAMILAMLGGDKEAASVLKEAYPKADKQIKVQILEALAKVGDPDTIDFLLERLEEPFQVLRVVAATAIIQCLYH